VFTERSVHRIGALALKILVQMQIKGASYRDRRMPEQFLNQPERRSLTHHERRCTMPEIVKPN
jgi:hypothetical protein